MDKFAKELEDALKAVLTRFKNELRGMRSNRPSLELIENIQVSYFDSMMSVKQLGTLALVPPREIRITVWDKNAVQPIMKAITDAGTGFTVANDGNTIHANLSAMSAERREELARLVKKTAEGFRIEIRNLRDSVMKKTRAAEESGELTKDQLERGKEKLEKIVKDINGEIDNLLNEKIKELSE